MHIRSSFLANQPLARIIFSIILDYSFAAKLLFSAQWSPTSTLGMSGEGRLWAIGEEIHVLLVLGFPLLPFTLNYHHPPTLPTPSLQPEHSLPIGPRISPLLTSLMLSQQTLRLKLIAFSAESCGDVLVINAENNTCPKHSYLECPLFSCFLRTCMANLVDSPNPFSVLQRC